MLPVPLVVVVVLVLVLLVLLVLLLLLRWQDTGRSCIAGTAPLVGCGGRVRVYTGA